MAHQNLQTYLRQEIAPEDTIALSIFGTTNIDAISAVLNQYCKQQFRQEIISCSFAYLSAGATFVVRLSNKQQIVLKAYGDRHELPTLIASFRVQQSLAQTDFPCPDVLNLPKQIGQTKLTAQSFQQDPYSQELEVGACAVMLTYSPT